MWRPSGERTGGPAMSPAKLKRSLSALPMLFRSEDPGSELGFPFIRGRENDVETGRREDRRSRYVTCEVEAEFICASDAGSHHRLRLLAGKMRKRQATHQQRA